MRRLLFFVALAACTGSQDTGDTTPADTDTGDTDQALACGDPASYDEGAFTLEELRPSGCTATTPEAPCAAHHLWTPDEITRDELVVILPGTFMEPDKHDGIARMAGFAGYRALGLSYDTRYNMNDFCGSTGDLTCHGAVRDVALFGGTHTEGSSTYRVDETRAVVPRLLAVLGQADWGDAHLLHDPTGADDVDAIDWSTIVLVGFSMGGGQSGRLAQHRGVHGVFMLDGAKDPVMIDDERDYATWTTESTATDGCRFFGAYHADGSEPHELVNQWVRLGTPDVEADADDLPFALGDAHLIVTGQVDVGDQGVHGSMARDGAMPSDATSGTAPSSLDEVHLFVPYLEVFCSLGDLPEDCAR